MEASRLPGSVPTPSYTTKHQHTELSNITTNECGHQNAGKSEATLYNHSKSGVETPNLLAISISSKIYKQYK